MPSTINNAGSGASGTIGGFTGVAWSNPGNISLSDNTYTTAALSNLNTTSQALQATNFGFNVPLHSTIDGIVCEFERKASASSVIRDSHIYLIYNNNVLGNNKVSAPAYWLTTESDVSFGSAADTWGAGISAEVVNSSSFGVLIDAQYYSAYTGTETAYVDRIRMTVFYTINFLCKFGSTNIISIKYGSTAIAKVYYGSTRVI